MFGTVVGEVSGPDSALVDLQPGFAGLKGVSRHLNPVYVRCPNTNSGALRSSR